MMMAAADETVPRGTAVPDPLNVSPYVNKSATSPRSIERATLDLATKFIEKLAATNPEAADTLARIRAAVPDAGYPR